jgi:hypothetical protein
MQALVYAVRNKEFKDEQCIVENPPLSHCGNSKMFWQCTSHFNSGTDEKKVFFFFL